MLTKDQKIEVVRARISVLETSIYNIETLLLEENAKSQPIQIVIDELNPIFGRCKWQVRRAFSLDRQFARRTSNVI